MVEHSRAPWDVHINDRPVSLTGRIEVTTLAGIVCLIHPWEDPLDLADARLIAAAPDQYAAAKELDRWRLVIESAIRNDAPSDHAAICAALRANMAAIAKAEGRPSR